MSLLIGSCRLNGAPHVDLFFSVINSAPETVIVEIRGTADYTLTVRSCSEQGVGLSEGDYSVQVIVGERKHMEAIDLSVPLRPDVPAERAILVRPDGSIDPDSSADPNAAPC